ncbi:MAG TPA: HAD-IC family P-type ATPase, partial [Hyphomicrobiaceae bacterium]|nr:HAD-IC family P-type ATPase [Hyphomicrobiaceae bacterium]
CALALAVPAVQIAASGRLFSRGVLVKAADGLERLADVDTVVFDKTGTLTLGEPRLSRICGDSVRLEEAAKLAASSRHPYARALVQAARDRGVTVTAIEDVKETSGQGLEVDTGDGVARLGSPRWCEVPLDVENTEGAGLWYRAGDGALVGFHFEDELRPDAKVAVGDLKRCGYRIALLSGDRVAAVQSVAEELGIAAWKARQTPAQKIAYLEALKAEGRKILMIGDGLNDAPALTAAHASVSPATAADITQTTADAIFQGEPIGPIIDILAVAKRARRMALENFAIALAYNAVFVPMAIAGIVTPLIAAVAMSASSIAVTSNAVRLRSRKLELSAL